MQEQKKASTSRRYTPEQKDQVVRLVRKLRAETGERHGAVRRVADQLGYGVESVRSWVNQADIDEGGACGDHVGGFGSDQEAGTREPRVAAGQ